MSNETAAPLAPGRTADVTSDQRNDTHRVTNSLPPCTYNIRVHKIARLEPHLHIGAIQSLAEEFKMNFLVVRAAVEVEYNQLRCNLSAYRPAGLPSTFKRWAVGTEEAVRHHANIKHWFVISEYAPPAISELTDERLEGVGLLSLPAFSQPDDFRWPVHGLPTTCILGAGDVLRQEQLARVLLEYQATIVRCRVVDEDGNAHVTPYLSRGAA